MKSFEIANCQFRTAPIANTESLKGYLTMKGRSKNDFYPSLKFFNLIFISKHAVKVNIEYLAHLLIIL